MMVLPLVSRAEDAVDKLIEVTPTLKSKIRSPCRTLLTHFVGYEGVHCQYCGKAR